MGEQMAEGSAPPKQRRGHFLASLVIPFLIVLSILSSTGSHPLEVEHFEKNEAEFQRNAVIGGVTHSVYAFNIEQYESPGCCADEERGWYPNLLNTADSVSVDVRLMDHDGNRYENGRHYGGGIFCSRGLDNCAGEATKEGKWLALEENRLGSMGYVAYQNTWFSSAKLLVAVQEPYVPIELEVELDKKDHPSHLAMSILLVPFGAFAAFAAFSFMGRSDLARSAVLISRHGDVGIELSYEMVASNAFLRVLVASYHLNLMMWWTVDGDWWHNPGLFILGLMLCLMSFVFALDYFAVPAHMKGKKAHLVGGVMALPICVFFCITASLFVVAGPNG
ncbi:MAG: hypothetical protein VXW72_01925 [Candidatus Thermoplasmatota archaeon]|nr:hypothetical protein [Candidatus Thermoplasmatota archaeon]